MGWDEGRFVTKQGGLNMWLCYVRESNSTYMVRKAAGTCLRS